jgi:hypothetical protein
MKRLTALSFAFVITGCFSTDPAPVELRSAERSTSLDDLKERDPCPPATVSTYGAIGEDGRIRKQEGLEHCPDIALVGDFPPHSKGMR